MILKCCQLNFVSYDQELCLSLTQAWTQACQQAVESEAAKKKTKVMDILSRYYY
jgi:hypothetical protein